MANLRPTLEEPSLYPLSVAKSKLGELVKRAIQGQEIALTKHGIPAVILVPVGSYEILMTTFNRDVERTVRSRNVTEPSQPVTRRHGVAGEGA